MEGHIHIEEVKLENQDGEDEESFCEAFEEFPVCDCSEDSHKSTESDVSSIVTVDSEFKPEILSPPVLRRRRYTSNDDDSTDSTRVSSCISFEEKHVVYRGEKIEYSAETEESEEESQSLSRVSENPDVIKLNLSSETAKGSGSDDAKEVNSGISYTNNARVHDFILDDVWNVKESPDVRSSFLTVLAGLVMKAIGYQFNLLINFFKFPLWLSSVSFMFVMDPLTVLRQGREYLTENAMRIWSSTYGDFLTYISECFREPQKVVGLALKFMWGFLWSVYVGVVLMTLLVSAFIIGSILMRAVVEEPIKLKEKLDFDYTGKSPVEYVPIIACPEACYGTDCSQRLEISKLGKFRAIPPDHKLQVTVSLTLPESDYNRNLGIFQVRVDFLAADGKVLASTRQPTMLQFRSQPIHLLLTFLKVPPILYGFASETQNLKIKFKGFTESAATPTACLRVTIEKRAAFQRSSGIPEITSASLTLESVQPGLKRIVWCWRKTLFVWISMTICTMELLFVLLCCSPIIMPRVKLGGNSARNSAVQETAVQLPSI